MSFRAEPRPIISEPAASDVETELILGVREQLLPRADRHEHSLGTPMRSEEHGVAVSGIETPGDLAQCRADLAGGHNCLSHG